jgi:pimeloyl-ACP methyl ester carboxylesterase
MHANGLHKETWEPTLEDLQAYSTSAFSIEEVWLLDTFNQGDSGVINAPRLGQTADWVDVGRDAAQFIVNYLPPVDTAKDLPYILPSQQLYGTSPRLNSLGVPSMGRSFPTWRGRHIILGGHSMGGAGSIVAATGIPGLLSGIICVDPVLSDKEARSGPNAKGALVRKDTFPSRAAALESWARNAQFFGKWDRRVLEAYAEHALKDMPDGTVALKCEREQEAVCSRASVRTS